MLAYRLVLVCLFGLFAAGCTITDRQPTTQSNISQANPQGETQGETTAKQGNKTEKLGHSQEPTQTTSEMLAFAAPEKTVAREPDYHLPHATPQTQALIKRYAKAYDVPERLVRRVVRRESHGNPLARNGPYWGLMQISYPTAQSMGYQGAPEGLLDAQTNLKYAVKYLAGAYLVAEGDETQSVRLYARGFYYDAKAKGLLERTGLRPGPTSIMTAFADE